MNSVFLVHGLPHIIVKHIYDPAASHQGDN